MSKKHDVKWAEVAAALPSGDFQLGVPLATLLGEAEDVATFFDKYWATQVDSKSKRVTRLGLDSVGHRLPKSTGDEIRELIPLAQSANLALERTVDPKSPTGVIDQCPAAGSSSRENTAGLS